MSTPNVNIAIIQAAEDACADARTRARSGDTSCTVPELAAYKDLLEALKSAGVRDPFAEIVEKSMLGRLAMWTAQRGPLEGRRLTPASA